MVAGRAGQADPGEGPDWKLIEEAAHKALVAWRRVVGVAHAWSVAPSVSAEDARWLRSLVGEAEQAAIAAVTVGRLQIGPEPVSGLIALCPDCYQIDGLRLALLDADYHAAVDPPHSWGASLTQPWKCSHCGRETLYVLRITGSDGLTPGGGASTPEGGTRVASPETSSSVDDRGDR